MTRFPLRVLGPQTAGLLSLALLGLLAGASADPPRSLCEIRAEVTDVTDGRVALALRLRGEALVPGAEMSVLVGDRAIGMLRVDSLSGSEAFAAVTHLDPGQSIAPGAQAVAPCPLPVTAVGERWAFVALPAAHGLADGTRVTASRQGRQLGEFELVLAEGGSPYVRPLGAAASTLRVGDVCYAIAASSGERAPPRLQAAPSAGTLVVTAVDDEWVYMASAAGVGSPRPTGPHGVARGGRLVARVEFEPTGPLRARIATAQAGERVQPGDTVGPWPADAILAPAGAEPPSAPVAPTAESPAPPPPPATVVAPQEPAPPPIVRAAAPEPKLRHPPAGPRLGVTFHGPTGLLRTPNAEVLSEGAIRLSITLPAEVAGSLAPDSLQQWVLGAGFLPGLEGGVAYNPHPGRDLTAHGKLRVLRESEHWPALAIGASNLRGAGGENFYAVASKALFQRRVRASAGYSHGPLNGVFGGVEVRLAPWATAIAEYDTHRVNTALRFAPTPRLQIDVADLRGGLSTQAAYWFKLGQGGGEAPPVDLRRPESDAEPQALADDLARAIAALGMENVRVALGDSPRGLTAGISYENRRYYRDQLEPLGHVLATAARRLPERVKYVSVVVLNHQVPVLRFGTLLGDYRRYVRGEASTPSYRNMVTVDHGLRPEVEPAGIVAVSSRLRSTRLSADLSLTPTVRTIFGSETITLAARTGLRPQLDADLGSGWRLLAARDLRVTGHLGGLGFLFSDDQANLNYVFRGASSLMGHVGAGDFADGRRGVAAEGFWLPPGSSVMVRGYVGGLSDLRFVEPTGLQWSYLGDLRYWVGSLALEAGVTFGRYLDADDGFALSLRRFFGDSEIKLEYRDTNYANTLVLQATMPIAPHRYPRPGRFRLRLGDRVQVSSRAALGGFPVPDDTLPLTAQTGNQLRFFDLSDDFLNRDRFGPGAVLSHLELLRSTAGPVPR